VSKGDDAHRRRRLVAVAWEWVGPTATAVVGLAGILATWRVSRGQGAVQVKLLRQEHHEQRRRELLAERRRVYSAMIGELTNIEAHIDYHERLRRQFRAGLAEDSGDDESATVAADERAEQVVGTFDDVEHFKRLHDLAAQVGLVCGSDLRVALNEAVGAAMHAVAGLLQRVDRGDLDRLRQKKETLLGVMIFETRIRPWTGQTYESLMAEYEAERETTGPDPASPT
jgi:hypothetical protein